jgi:hypothetical protein
MISSANEYRIPLRFGDQILAVSKIHESDFTAAHHETLSELKYDQRALHFPDPRWCALYLGAGEEKAVFCVCDQDRRVFAVEMIDERHYLNGRFVGGEYFFNKRVKSLATVKANADSEFGLTFTGLIKVREFVYGYEWARFQFDPRKRIALDSVLTGFLQSALAAQFREYQAHYKDVHARNVLFEIRDWRQSGVPIITKNWAGKIQTPKIRLQPVDVR